MPLLLACMFLLPATGWQLLACLPIALAAYAGFETTVKKLRAAGAAIDLPQTWTPLSYAAAGGQDAIVPLAQIVRGYPANQLGFWAFTGWRRGPDLTSFRP